MRWLTLVLGIYLLYGTLLFAVQRRMLYPGAMVQAASPQPPEGLSVRPVRLTTSVGAVDAWYLPPARPGGRVPAIVHAHGNAEWMGAGAERFRSFTRAGFAILLVEYPGYGTSDGRPSRETIAETMRAAWDWVAARPEVDSASVVGWGRSLGTGAITDLAGTRPLAGMILQSPYTRTAWFARQYLLPGFLVRDRFDNVAGVSAFDGPVLVFHGARDEVIPHAHGAAVAAAAPGGVLVSQDCGHNDCPPDWNRFTEQVLDGLRSVGVGPVEMFRMPRAAPPTSAPVPGRSGRQSPS